MLPFALSLSTAVFAWGGGIVLYFLFFYVQRKQHDLAVAVVSGTVGALVVLLSVILRFWACDGHIHSHALVSVRTFV